jgi:ABC-type Fe3+ transport system permease subunit/DNA-binding beta-propeller fold protein YncE
MSRDPAAKCLAAASLALWAALVAAPLVWLYVDALAPRGAASAPARMDSAIVGQSFALAAGIAALSVLLGFVPGELLGTAGRGRTMLAAMLLAALLLPRYLLLYAWNLLRSPTTPLGDYLAARPELARAAGVAVAAVTLLLWYWPLAALLIGQGFRNLDRDSQSNALLDAGPWRRLIAVTLPQLLPTLALAFGLCLTLLLAEFATFHLAGVRTIGAELATLYEQTGSTGAVAVAALPVVIPAGLVAVVLWRRARDWSTHAPLAEPDAPGRMAWRWAVAAALLALTVVAPVSLLAASVRDLSGFSMFWGLHREELATSLLASSVAAAAALVMAGGAISCASLGRAGRTIAAWTIPTMLLAALIPGSLIGAALVHLQAGLHARTGLAEGWWSVSAGLAARLAGVALVMLRLGLDLRSKQLSELAATDGAGSLRTWWSVHLPRQWPVPAGAFVLVAVLGLTELPATSILLPAGVPNFAQSLLNQMHYARDQQVIATCLVLVGGYAMLAGAVLAVRRLLRRGGARAVAAWLLAACVAGLVAGCESTGRNDAPHVVRHFGASGPGPGEFLYPRAIDIAADGTVCVVDKTARLQHFDAGGKYLGSFTMPEYAAGKPTGLTISPDGNLWVPDTHYHRVIVFRPDGREVLRFGRYGTGAGEMIFPTDVAFAGDGRVLVSEYGGNDRVTIWTLNGKFLGSFGSLGAEAGQLSRPSALAVDAARNRLYVADACNHRIAVYDLAGKLERYIGSVGAEAGRLRYPYGLALAGDGRIVVCEYGNNRIQVFSPEGRSLAVLGGPGRRLGELAYPWGVALDGSGLAYVVDAGNNRIQAWRLR